MDYLQIAKDVVARAAARGVQAEAYINDSLKTELRVDKGQVEQLSQSGEKGIGIRIIDGGRTGYAYTSNFSQESLDQTTQIAIELAAIGTADENTALPDPQPIPDEDLEIFDPNFENITTEQKIELAKQTEQAALAADPRMKMAQVQYGDELSRVYMANSKGFAGSYARTTMFVVVVGYARDEAVNDQANAYEFSVTNMFSELDPQSLGRAAARKTTLTLGGKAVPTQTATVVFDPIVMSQILGAIAGALNAKSMQRGRSFLIGKVGQEVASDKVTLLDNGRMKRGLASAPFDGEGVPTSATRLMDEGVLQTPIYDSYSARKEGVVSTGNAKRDSHRAMPNLGISNFYLQPGYKSQDEIIGEVKNGMYVTRIMQTGGIDPVNGDCSMAASGMWIQDGKLTDPINGVTIATTLNDLLKNVAEVGADLRIVPFGGAIASPTVRVDNVTIGGTKS